MSIFTECQAQLIDALKAWDFRGTLPGSWPVAFDGVMLATRDPVDLIENILGEDATLSRMTQPIITVIPASSDAAWTSLGGYVPNISATTHRPLRGQRAAVKFTVSAWADQALGGEDTAIGLAGEVFGCMIYNCNRLPSLRRLRPASTDTAYEDHAEIWVAEVHVEGTVVVNYDG